MTEAIAVFKRIGDFYEYLAPHEQCVEMAELLGRRVDPISERLRAEAGLPSDAYTVGVPYHEWEQAKGKLTEAGYEVVLWPAEARP